MSNITGRLYLWQVLMLIQGIFQKSKSVQFLPSRPTLGSANQEPVSVPCRTRGFRFLIQPSLVWSKFVGEFTTVVSFRCKTRDRLQVKRAKRMYIGNSAGWTSKPMSEWVAQYGSRAHCQTIVFSLMNIFFVYPREVEKGGAFSPNLAWPIWGTMIHTKTAM